MNGALPDPLVPAEVDLNGYEFMPLYGDRLFGSDFSLEVSDQVFRVGLKMWWTAWKQVPAASLPGNETSLCKLAGFESLPKWRRVRDQVMRNVILCSDGRYYHLVLAPLAMQAWQKRVENAAKGKKGAAKRWSSHPKKMPAPVDNHGTATEGDSPGHRKRIARPSDSDAPAIENDSKGSEISLSTSVQGRDSAPSQPAQNPEKDESKPRAMFTATNEWERRLLAEGRRYGIQPGNSETWKQFESRVKTHRSAA